MFLNRTETNIFIVDLSNIYRLIDLFDVEEKYLK